MNQLDNIAAHVNYENWHVLWYYRCFHICKQWFHFFTYKFDWVFSLKFIFLWIAFKICDKKVLFRRNLNKTLAAFTRPRSLLIWRLFWVSCFSNSHSKRFIYLPHCSTRLIFKLHFQIKFQTYISFKLTPLCYWSELLSYPDNGKERYPRWYKA